jgi:hypothetical protein
MLIEPASKASVPFTVVIRTLSNSAERDFDPPDILVPESEDPRTPEATQEYAELLARNRLIAPSTVALAETEGVDINPVEEVALALDPVDALLV